NNPAVTVLRDLHFADLCGLWVGSGTYAGACGIGYLNTNPTDYNDMAAFTVTDFNCGMTNLTYAHECGHNMGLRHDFYVDASTSPCDHHHGYTNQIVIPGGLPVAGRWRTIMAYNNQCSDNGFNCTRLPRWANPSLNYLGDAMGRAIGMAEPSDEIYGFERFRCAVSTFRNAGVPLPILAGSFAAKANGHEISLTWKVNADMNCKGFDLEVKRTFTDEFTKLSFTPANEFAAGNQQYYYTMANALPGTYYFRLKSIDQDNNFMYSAVLKVDVTGGDLYASVYPNPVKDNFTLSFNNPAQQAVQISFYDMAGKEVMKVPTALMAAGNQQLQIPATGLQKGIYFCQILCGQNKTITKLVID
ncbi:MAG: zinc-dependent metalloprotease, partial [Chitinophagaceae bacterium]|nr:zinc-dependent metalloprotease [Chitinophagaceae bacterium]